MEAFKTGVVRALAAFLGTAILAGALFAVNGYVNTKTATSLLGQKNYSDTTPFYAGPGAWQQMHVLGNLSELEEVSFLLNSNGLPRVAFVRGGGLYYSEYSYQDNTNEGWTLPQLIDTNLHIDEELSLVFDGNGDTHIGYKKNDGYAHHAYWYGGLWSTETITATYGCSSPILAAHPSDTTIFVAFYENSDTFWIDDFQESLPYVNCMGGTNVSSVVGGAIVPVEFPDSGPAGLGDTALQLYFNMSSPGYYGDYSFALTNNRALNLNNVTYLVFDVKRDSGTPSVNFRIEIEDDQGDTSSLLLTDLGETTTTSWQTIVVPLSSFVGSADRSNLRFLSFFLSYELGDFGGTLYFDNIRFEDKIQPNVPPLNLCMIARESAWPSDVPHTPMASATHGWGDFKIITTPNGANDLIYYDHYNHHLRYVRGAGNDFVIEDNVSDFATRSNGNFSASLLYYDTSTHEVCYGNIYLGINSILNQDTVALDINHSNAGKGADLSLDFNSSGETCVGYSFNSITGGTVSVWMNRGAGYDWFSENPSFLAQNNEGFVVHLCPGTDTVLVGHPDLSFTLSLDGKETTTALSGLKKPMTLIGAETTGPAPVPGPYWPHQEELFLNPFGLSAYGTYLYVSDAAWNRVLVFPLSSAGVTSTQAVGIFGQPNYYAIAPDSGNNLSSPSGITHDAFGNLWVADRLNDRVVRFNLGAGGVPGDAVVDFVIGQAGIAGTGDTLLCAPFDVAFDPFGNLWIADNSNNRVLRFNADADGLVSDSTADFVIGQSDFTTSSYGVSDTMLWHPEGIAFDPVGNLWVCDERNNRVLLFASNHLTTIPEGSVPAPELVIDATADTVWGQPSFDTNTPGIAGNRSASPLSVAISSCGYAYLSEGADMNGNNRVLRFDPTMLCGYVTTFTPDFVIGQTDFITNDSGTSNTLFRAPENVCVDDWGNLWVADAGNHRVLMFLDPPDRPIMNTSFGHCFIASALWGAGSEEAAVLRAFRDQHLLTNRAGRLFVKTYMAVSPSLTRQWNGCASCSSFWSRAFTPVVGLASFAVEYGLGALLVVLGIPMLLAGLSPFLFKKKERC